MNIRSTASRSRRFGRALWSEWLRPLAIPVLLVTAAKSSFADINYVPSGSMQPTILAGDVVFINKLAYDLRVPFTFARLARWADPARGDIVVCFAPDDGTRLVKRVVGLPSDSIELRNEVLFINGEPQAYEAPPASLGHELTVTERSRAVFATERLGGRAHSVMALPAVAARRNFGPIHLPAGSYFMMGDNRDNSRDSRFFGVVPRREIIGEVKGVFVSGDLDHWLQPRPARFFSRLE